MRRVFMSVYLWTMISLVTLLSFLILVPIAALLAPFDQNRNATHWAAFIWARTIFFLNPLWTLRVEGKENLRSAGAHILAVNHQSIGDIITLYALGVPFKWVSKKSMFYVPLIGWSMFIAGYIPVVRDNKESRAKCVRLSKSWLYRDVSIMMFPEGTRSPDGKVHPFKDGAFRMSIETGVPVIPIALEGTGAVVRKHSWLLDTRVDITLVIGEPIKPPVRAADARTCPKEVKAMRDAARKWIVREVARLRNTSVAAVDATYTRPRSMRVPVDA